MSMRCLVSVSMIATVLGCGGATTERHPEQATPDGGSSATASAEAAPAKRTGARGLDAPGNNPEVVALARGILTCNWKVGTGHSDDCPPGKAWYETKLFDDNKNLDTLVSFLDDENPTVRALAAEAMSTRGHEYDDDAKLSERVVAAAEAERSEELLERLGSLAGNVSLERTNLTDRVLALASKGPLKLRAALIEDLFPNNPRSLKVFAFVKAATNGKEPEISEAAIRSLTTAYDLEVCELLTGLLKGSADQASNAAWALTYGGNGACSSSFDAVLDWAEKRAATPAVEDVARLCADREATVAQEKRGAKILRGWVENPKLEKWVRSNALSALPKCDADSAAYAAKLKTDDEELARTAGEVAKAPTEATGPAPDVLAPAKPEPPPIDAKAKITQVQAVTFLTDWKATPPMELRDRFPPGLYRVEGTVVGLDKKSGGGLELTIAGPAGDALKLDLAGSHARAARSKRRGDAAKALCSFNGVSYGGFVTFEDCHWEGGGK